VGDNRGITIMVALISAVATILGALIASGRWAPPFLERTQETPVPSPDVTLPSIQPPGIKLPSVQLPLLKDEAAAIVLSRESGPGGATVKVSGEGFAAGERVVIRFDTKQVGSTRTNDQGRFANVAVTVPESFSQFAAQKFIIAATGESSRRAAEAPFTISG
jgi:hypothetical protein